MAKRARTEDYERPSESKSSYETQALRIMQTDTDRRAVHENKIEELVLKCLEELQATRRSLELFIERKLH